MVAGFIHSKIWVLNSLKALTNLHKIPVLGQLIGNTDALGTSHKQLCSLPSWESSLVSFMAWREDKIISSVMNGAACLVFVALIVAVARGIQVIMNDGMITATILHWGEEGLERSFISIVHCLDLHFYLPMSFLIPSSSGLASATMGIMAPLGKFVNVPGSLIVTAYQSASGVLNLIAPTSGIVMGALALGRVDLSAWWKFMGKLVIAIVVITIALLLLGTVVPFLQ